MDPPAGKVASYTIPEGQEAIFMWWMDTAYHDFNKTMPKAQEYGGSGVGSADLRVIGRNQAELLGWDPIDMAVAEEIGCWFYLQGKTARLISDYQVRRRGKPDTWFDSTVYTMMARRLQEVGRWP